MPSSGADIPTHSALPCTDPSGPDTDDTDKLVLSSSKEPTIEDVGAGIQSGDEPPFAIEQAGIE